MKGGGSNKFRVKNLFLSLFALLCFSFALWAWDQTPVLTTLLPPSADSDTPFVSPVISMVSPETRNTQLQSFTMDSQSDSSTKKNISAAAKSKESHNQTFEMTKEEDKLKMVTSEKKGLYKSNGFLKVSCNGGLNQMRSAICDMVAVAHLLNLTLVVPELDKTSFWSDRSQFSEIFNLEHFINSLKDDVRMIKRLPKRLSRNPNDSFSLFPVSWSTEKYYLEQILPLFNKYNVIHFKKSDARLANNCLPAELQKLRCRVNYHALKFTPQLEALGNKLVDILQGEGPFVALHLRYEMDMLAFSGCTHGCSEEEAKELKRMRYAYPWWREKEINSESRRLQGHCPLTPEETSLVLQALGFGKNTKIYIASGEIYGGDSRLAALRAAFPQLLTKETLLNFEDLRHFSNHSSQMAALDFIVSLASDVFIPTYDGNMAKVVEGHRRFLGYKKSIVLDRRRTVQLIDLYENKTLSWDQFVASVREIHETRVGLPACRSVRADKPKEEDSFYANPYECLQNSPTCHAADPAGANASAN